MERRYDNKGSLIWVAPGALRYDRTDTEFILPWLFEMREGAYPIEPSVYSGGNRSGISSRASYETACQVAAELDRRLAHTGLDRILVEHSYCDRLSAHDLATRYGMEDWEATRHITSAVSYIASGKCGRWLPCSGETWDCLLFTRCRKHRPAINYRDWTRQRRHQWNITPKVPHLLLKT